MSFLFVFIFIVTLFIYLHMYKFLNINTDVKIYDVDFESKEQLTDILNDKIPFKISNLNQEYFSNAYTFFSLPMNFETKSTSEKKIVLYSYDDFLELNNDTKKIIQSTYFDIDNYIEKQNNCDASFAYFSCDNQQFVHTMFDKYLEKLSIYLKPDFTLQQHYDMLMGMKHMQTGLTYSYYNHTYIIIKQGDVSVRMYSPNIIPELYRKFNNKIDINVWDTEKTSNTEQFKYIDIQLKTGDILYIPTYWSYSIFYNNPSIIFSVKYHSLMSYCMHFPYKIIDYISYLNIETKKIKDENILKPL